jgi:polyhydroxyalkanoate synthase subunit PhaC
MRSCLKSYALTLHCHQLNKSHLLNTKQERRRFPAPTPGEAMQTFSSGIQWWFESLDRARKRRGVAMDQMGYGPKESDFKTVLSAPGMRLRFYGGPVDSPNIALIVPAPIKRHYIWDLAPECSVIQRALHAGMQVYLVEWTEPESQNHLGLEDYAYRILDLCVKSIRTVRRSGELFLLSHSLGGIFTAIYAALRPEQVAGLVLVEAPLHFAKASGSFWPMVAFGPRAENVTRVFDRVPGSVLSLASVVASPSTFNLERYADFIASLGSPKNLKSHLAVERWTLDESPMSNRLFEQVVDQLYREDSFMRNALTIAGRRIGPQQVTSPLLAVYDPHSVIIPPDSIIAFHEAAASKEKRLLDYQGDTGVAIAHVGALMGENAHRQLWPEILGWIGDVGASRH